MKQELLLAKGTDLPVVDMVAEGAKSPGGIARYVDRMHASLIELGVDVRLLPFRYVPGAQHRAVLKALPISVQGRRPGSIVHIPQILGASVLLFDRIRSPVVVTVHDLGVLDCPEDRILTTSLSRQLLRLSLSGMRRADHLIAVSEFTRQGLLRAGYAPDRVSTIHEGVDLDRFRPIPEAASLLAKRYAIDLTSRPVVLYVGNEFPRKNLVTLVRALGYLRRQGVRTHWVKVGAPGYAAGREQLRAVISEEQLDGDVTFVERIPDGDLPLFYSAATVYVQPSVFEGFGLPVLEAIACGIPVVASNVASLPEIGGGIATLVEPDNPTSFAEAIIQVLLGSQRGKRSRREELEHLEGFSWSHGAQQTQRVYNAISS